MDKKNNKTILIVGEIVFTLICFGLILQLVALNGDPNHNVNYTAFYNFAGAASCAFIVLSFIWAIAYCLKSDSLIFKLIAPFGLLSSDNHELTPLGGLSFKTRVSIILLLALIYGGGALAVNSSRNSANMIKWLPTVSAYSYSAIHSVSPFSSVYLSSVPVAFFEDLLFNYASPYMLWSGLILLLVFNPIKQLRVNPNRIIGNRWFNFWTMTLCCLISSSGIGWMLPGFSSAHAVYYGNMPAQESTFFFGFLASELNMMTGIFGSWIAHAVHNAAVTTGELNYMDYHPIPNQIVNTTVGGVVI